MDPTKYLEKPSTRNETIKALETKLKLIRNPFKVNLLYLKPYFL
jgi:hypothetical protein